eukprot:CAMPEP_0113632898 /NCGR_PEP_ID=MMETSP0017_2-20120614/17108_1 /TAXON_ID=2856 /ORGANISM="Cylindrotheca closterium" /LENGTH=135 /DNA_ID=CAMNT_0000543489 /DNA_START=325 /DNA_END=729 /DNA_ORIENTATION=+ /assembly_acc=CAM_ASM_000147
MSETNTTTTPPPTTPTQQAEMVWSRNSEEAAAAAAGGEQKQQQEGQGEETKEEGGTFVNHGLIKWEKGRADWHAMKLKKIQEQAGSSSTTPDHLRQSLPLDVDEIIDIIFSPRWRMAGAETGPPKRFPQNVPLVQ